MQISRTCCWTGTWPCEGDDALCIRCFRLLIAILLAVRVGLCNTDPALQGGSIPRLPGTTYALYLESAEMSSRSLQSNCLAKPAGRLVKRFSEQGGHMLDGPESHICGDLL